MVSAVLLALSFQSPVLEITKSGSWSPPRAVMPSADVDHPAVVIRGDNLTIDFGNRSLRGTPETTDPDKREGTGVQVIGNNVTIRHAKISGYKVAILARDCKGLKILDSDLSYNWKQHLKSTPEKEDLSDWMSYHHNEGDEWLHTYAGALYLNGCNDFEVRSVRIEGGQCGLMMTKCDRGLVWNNNFSFLSGLGIGMYRSSENRIMHNKIDWCVRGHSEGVYNRGQDSAGILVYEQSNRNTFAYNSVTHGGDGFFLWAGQTTMDTGQGGCNDNLVYGNDFSSAPTNGIEATFSRNAFVNNKVIECWHGVWGGYSYDTKIWGNAFGYNAEAISIEHGQNNSVVSNSFWRDNDAIGLWANPETDPSWGYPKHRDTKSRDYDIRDNSFGNIPGTVFRVSQTTGLSIRDNRLDRFGKLFREGVAPVGASFSGNHLWTSDAAVKDSLGATNTVEVAPDFKPLPSFMQASGLLSTIAMTNDEYAKRFDVTWNPYPSGDPRRKEIEVLAPQPLKGGQDPFIKESVLRGRRYIIVDEWGPYDFKRPLLKASEPAQLKARTTQRFDVLGPRGHWRVIRAVGATLSAAEGEVPGNVDVTIGGGSAGNVDLVLEYRGADTVDYRGIVTPRGRAVQFGYSKFFLPIDWTVRFFKWSKAADPSDVHSVPEPSAFAAILRGAPVKELKRQDLDFRGYSFDPVTGPDHYATAAEGVFSVPAGDYSLELTTDDGARVWLDGKPLIEDAWHYQGPTAYNRDVHLSAGQHRLRVEHFQIDGYAMLKVEIKPKKS